MTIEDSPRPVGRDDLFTMQRTLSFTAAASPANAWFRAVVADKIEAIDRESFLIDGRWTLKVTAPSQPTIRQQQNQRELLIPVVFDGNKAKIELTYDW